MHDGNVALENNKEPQISSTQGYLSFLPFLVFYMCLCVYLGVYLCYGIFKKDLRDHTKPT
jgi:hypothetical protein